MAVHHQVRGDLVFDAGPDLVAVDEGQERLAAVRPRAEQQAPVVTHRERRTLRVGVGRQVRLKVVLVDREQVRLDHLRVDEVSSIPHVRAIQSPSTPSERQPVPYWYFGPCWLTFAATSR